MDTQTLRAAGRDLALLRRLSNPEVSQTETFSNIVLLRRLFIEGAIFLYWHALRSDERSKLTVEFSSIRTKYLSLISGEHLFVLTGDRWSDLLVGGGVEELDTRPDDEFREAITRLHGGLTAGPIGDLFERSIVLAHRDFRFTPKELIEYHAYTLGDVHLPPKSKTPVAIDAYERLLARVGESAPFDFRSGSNGPASLALKGVLNRVVRSEGFGVMFERLQSDGYIPDDVEYPAVPIDGLASSIFESACTFGTLSLKWTKRACEKGLPSVFEAVAQRRGSLRSPV